MSIFDLFCSMLARLPNKTKQFLIVIVKLLIIGGASYYIFNKLLNNESLDFNEFIAFLKENDSFSIKNMLFLIILTFFNWFFEILKWKKLVSSIKKISFKSTLEQSLGGQTASLITPNRIGDYGAKAIYYSKPFQKKIVLLNFLGNMAQMTVTILFGCIGLVLFNLKFQLKFNGFNFVLVLLIGVVALVFILYGLKSSKFKIKEFSIKRIIEFIKDLPLKIHIQNFGFSLLRYLIFSFQYYLLLVFFGIEITYISAMIVISSMYLLSSIIPTLAVFDVLVKTSVAVFFFSYLGIDEFTILSISTLMWLFNFMLPSVFGSYFVLNFKLPKTDD